MDRSFILPIAVAAGVHSMLFISGDGTTPIVTAPPPADRPPAWEVDILPEDLREVIETGEKSSEAPPAKPTPVSLERLTTLPDAGAIIQEARLQDLLPRPGSDINTINSGWEREAISGVANSMQIIDGINLDHTPAARFQPAPVFPQDLRSIAANGTATIRFSVDVHGNVFDAEVTRTSHSRFGEEAVRAVRRWRFEPGLKDGKRVAFRMVQTFSFTLSE